MDINAPAQLITAPAQPTATGVAVYTALSFFYFASRTLALTLIAGVVFLSLFFLQAFRIPGVATVFSHVRLACVTQFAPQ